MSRWHPIALALGAAALAVLWLMSRGAAAAQDPAAGDLRDIRVGSHVSELPLLGYVGRRCADGKALEQWTDYVRCPPRDDGLREVAFQYDESRAQWAAVSDKWEGTRVSGHPVVLSLLFDDEGTARALHINTDPSARAYMRKKAFLLRLRVLGRYGRDGWACSEQAAGDDLTPVGGMYINERCTKHFANRELTLTTKLYRTADQSLAEYTNSTRLEIRWLGKG